MKFKNILVRVLTCYINNITKVIKQSMEDKKPILVLEIITNKPMLKLLDFIKVQQSKSNDRDFIRIHAESRPENEKENKANLRRNP